MYTKETAILKMLGIVFLFWLSEATSVLFRNYFRSKLVDNMQIEGTAAPFTILKYGSFTCDKAIVSTAPQITLRISDVCDFAQFPTRQTLQTYLFDLLPATAFNNVAACASNGGYVSFCAYLPALAALLLI